MRPDPIEPGDPISADRLNATAREASKQTLGPGMYRDSGGVIARRLRRRGRGSNLPTHIKAQVDGAVEASYSMISIDNVSIVQPDGAAFDETKRPEPSSIPNRSQEIDDDTWIDVIWDQAADAWRLYSIEECPS